MNPFARMFLGAGRIDEPLRSELQAAGPQVFEEGLTGSIVYRNYREPGFRAGIQKNGAAAAIVVTADRLVVWVSRGRNSGRHIDVPIEMGRPAGIEVGTDGPDRVTFKYDPGVFHPDRSGSVEVRLKTPSAQSIAQRLEV